MPLDATDFGYVSILRDEPSPGDQTNVKVGGYCVVGSATSAMTPGDIVIADSSADDSYKTTTSANSTAVVGYVVAGATYTTAQWDFVSTISSGEKILVLIKGVVLATASAAITRGARVGTSTTAGQVVTTTTQDASRGIALQTATTQGDRIRVLV
jgi:hypothetical protein